MLFQHSQFDVNVTRTNITVVNVYRDNAENFGHAGNFGQCRICHYKLEKNVFTEIKF